MNEREVKIANLESVIKETITAQNYHLEQIYSDGLFLRHLVNKLYKDDNKSMDRIKRVVDKMLTYIEVWQQFND